MPQLILPKSANNPLSVLVTINIPKELEKPNFLFAFKVRSVASEFRSTVYVVLGFE